MSRSFLTLRRRENVKEMSIVRRGIASVIRELGEATPSEMQDILIDRDLGVRNYGIGLDVAGLGAHLGKMQHDGMVEKCGVKRNDRGIIEWIWRIKRERDR